MTNTYFKLKGRKNKIEWAKSELNYEKQKGEHTFHMCDCGRMGCRANKCIACWREELDKLRRIKTRSNTITSKEENK